jgi:hypothetical protein
MICSPYNFALLLRRSTAEYTMNGDESPLNFVSNLFFDVTTTTSALSVISAHTPAASVGRQFFSSAALLS